ncbi:MAG: hypothetical protein Q9168_001248 [Polycauliona sp. 1 TL-2023]
MSFPISLPSASPFHYQLAKQTCAPTNLWPNFKPSTPQSKDTSKFTEDLQHDPQTALDRAFTAARAAIQLDSATQQQLGWTPTPPPLHDQTENATMHPVPPTTGASLKRKAEAAGIQDDFEAGKNMKIEFVDFDTLFQKKRPGRPSKALQRPKKAMKGFRTNRPVAAELTRGDIWCNILENSHLSQLFRMRDVFRHYLLTWPTIWKTARRNTFGLDHPDPPPGKGCNDTRTRKVYWAFQRRWCVTCMKRNVAMNAGCNLFFRNYPNIPQCVPRAAFDQYGHYTCALGIGDNDKFTCTLSYGHNVRPPWLKQGYQDKIGWLRTDLARMSQELEKFGERVGLDEAGISDARKASVDEWRKGNNKLVDSLQSIEDWMETYKMNLRKEAETKREEKQAVLASLEHPDIPVDPDILDTTDALLDDHMLGTAALTTGQSEESSDSAEMQAEDQEENPVHLSRDGASWSLDSRHLNTSGSGGRPVFSDDYNVAQPMHDETLASYAKEYTAFADARVLTPPPETVAAIALAHQIVDEMGGRVADGEYVRVALMRTYKAYEEEWAVRRPDRPRQLLMDDARRVYQEVIEPRLDVRIKRSSFRRTEATGSVTCPGCKKGRGPVKLYSFPDLMTHVYERHARDASGDFADFCVDRFKLPCHVRFPWCSIEWPRNLPILAVGQDTKGRWDLNREGEEQPQLAYCEPGAFHGRIAAASMGPPGYHFVRNVLFAASQLEGSSVGDEFRTQMALEYATQKFESAQYTRPGFDLLEGLQLALMRSGVKGLFEGFRCQKCCEAVVHEGRVGYLARSVKPLGELSEHFRKMHVKEGDWTRNMLDLPSGPDLLAELQLPQHRSSLRVFDSLFPMREESILDPQLRELPGLDG